MTLDNVSLQREELTMGAEERMRVLQMVSEGKVSPEDADSLLSALETPPAAPTRLLSTQSLPPRPPAPGFATRSKLVVDIKEDGEDRVHVCIPLGLARAVTRLIPKDAQRFLEEAEISLDDLLNGLASADSDGLLVHIHDGDTEIHISVE